MNTIIINGKKVSVPQDNGDDHDYYKDKQQIFIIGSKGIPANYGGFETFVENLTKYKQSKTIQYHVARMSSDNIRFIYNGAECFNIRVPDIGAARAIYYDVLALHHCIRYCRERPYIKHPIFYILACRIGPFIGHFKRQIKMLGGKLYVNPDGHEWMRAKWSAPIRRYWKLSEKLMVKHADLLICDSKNIEQYIQNEYSNYHPRTTYIAYGFETKGLTLTDDNDKLVNWYNCFNIKKSNYYLIVGRFVPENNYETIIKEFMRSSTKKDLVIITNIGNNSFYKRLKYVTGFNQDPRIKFVGTVYDQELLKKIREDAYAYIHGHEVGGTNPSLLEALGSTAINLLLNVGFNREVAEDGAFYWEKEKDSLKKQIFLVEHMDTKKIIALKRKAKSRITNLYNWNYIIEKYEKIFLESENYAS